VAIVKPMAASRALIEAHRCVRIHHDEGGDLCVEATDFTATARTWLDEALSNADKGFDTLVPLADLEQAIKAAPKDGTLHITASESEVVIQAGRRKFRTVPPATGDWTTLDFEAKRELVIADDGGSLADSVTTASMFASSDETRPIMCGIYIDLAEPKAPRMVATNTYVMGVVDLTPKVGKAAQSVNIPATALKAALRKVDRDAGVTIEADHRSVAIRVPGAVYLARTIDGVFPDWRQFTPNEVHFVSARIDQGDLLGVAAAAKKALTHNAPLRVSFAGQKVRFGGSDGGRGFADELDAKIAYSQEWEAADKASGQTLGPYARESTAVEKADAATAREPALLRWVAKGKGKEWIAAPLWPIEYGLNPAFFHDVVWAMWPDDEGMIELRFGTPLKPVSYHCEVRSVPELPARSVWALQMPIRLNP
jgi:DNA polymerase III sliding clamp (beta) subunit (PCNA family)